MLLGTRLHPQQPFFFRKSALAAGLDPPVIPFVPYSPVILCPSSFLLALVLSGCFGFIILSHKISLCWCGNPSHHFPGKSCSLQPHLVLLQELLHPLLPSQRAGPHHNTPTPSFHPPDLPPSSESAPKINLCLFFGVLSLLSYGRSSPPRRSSSSPCCCTSTATGPPSTSSAST